MSCKTRQKSQEIQCERIVEVDTCGVSRMDYRDLTVTDIVIEEYIGSLDGSMGTGSRDPSLETHGSASLQRFTVPVPSDPVRITRIHRQNDITTQTNDSITKTEKREENTHVIQQNKSSPDKSVSVIPIIILLVVILIVIVVVRIVL